MPIAHAAIEAPRFKGRRLRAMLWLSAAMARLGVAPTPAAALRKPANWRHSIKPAAWMTYPLPSGVTIEYSSIPGREGALPVKHFIPGQVRADRPAVLFIHGGGWCSGSYDSLDYLCANVGAALGVRVLGIDYRLAPEHPYPAALHDCQDALRWMSAHHGQLGSAHARVAVMGDSAGGNLTAALCLLARGQTPAITAQVLIYPALDATLQSPSMGFSVGGLTSKDLACVLEAYMAGADPHDPLVSPLLAPELAGLPPTLILTADGDHLRDDGVRYTARLSEAGVAVRHVNYAGMPHGFFSLARLCACAPEALDEVIRFLATEASRA
jgi:acetyl esterase/lipase